ncbi:MAG: thioredoxin fold domain-containing protein [Candidatus Zixiibacteriota bacterium]|nr:MAG: thioredoxin fold domain-containing protein [candidate division Zixibacteria bacterium]
MKISIKFSVLVFWVMTISCGKKEPIPTQINFITDYNQAASIAEKSGKPMIIDFYADWSPWCDSLDINTYSDSLVISLSVSNVFVKIDAEVDTALADRFGLSGYPTIVITKSGGQEIDRIWGYLPATEFYNQVQLYLQGRETLEDYLSRLEDEPENLEYLSMIGEKYASRSMYDKSVEYYEMVAELDSDNEDGYAARALASIHDVQGRAKDYKTALETCLRLLRTFPDSPESDEAAALLGFYTAQDGDTLEALKLYKGYLKMNPDSENAQWVKKRIADLEGE